MNNIKQEIVREGGWMQTYSGIKFYPLSPVAEDIELMDIAHALSNICRFTGHTREFYSVAQHSTLVSRLVPKEVAIWALFHDASDAYMSRLPEPLINLPEFSFYRFAKDELQRLIYEKFGLYGIAPRSIEEADLKALEIEKRDLFKSAGWEKVLQPEAIIRGQNPILAAHSFMVRFNELNGGIKETDYEHF